MTHDLVEGPAIAAPDEATVLPRAGYDAITGAKKNRRYGRDKNAESKRDSAATDAPEAPVVRKRHGRDRAMTAGTDGRCAGVLHLPPGDHDRDHRHRCQHDGAGEAGTEVAREQCGGPTPGQASDVGTERGQHRAATGNVVALATDLDLSIESSAVLRHALIAGEAS
jgi:hypothetical protein